MSRYFILCFARMFVFLVGAEMRQVSCGPQPLTLRKAKPAECLGRRQGRWDSGRAGTGARMNPAKSADILSESTVGR